MLNVKLYRLFFFSLVKNIYIGIVIEWCYFYGMIKATELRLFNIVSWNGSTDTVLGIGHDYPDCEVKLSDLFGGVAWVKEKDIEGIALNPKWLERCGFEWYSNIHRWRHQGTGYLVVENDKGFDSGYGDGSTKRAPLMYVHHLQNIHLDVTGVEIIINTTALT